MTHRQTISVQTKSLKDLLRLFEEEALLENLELGDTWHPFSGYIDEKIFGTPPTVKQVLRFDYDFKGLVRFAARIGKVQVELIGQKAAYTFNLTSEPKKIRQLEDLVRQHNAFAPGRYKIQS